MIYQTKISVAKEGKIQFKFVLRCSGRILVPKERRANKLLERAGSHRTFFRLEWIANKFQLKDRNHLR